jgi:DNA-binding MarR family transcriptional regulator
VSGAWRPIRMSSSQQRVVLLYLAQTRNRGNRTLAEIARVVGITSRGQVSRELRRLRQLELISYQTTHGARGRHRIWLRRSAARLRARLDPPPNGRNDSLSALRERFISAKGLAAARDEGGDPLLPGRPAARDGPRRGHGAPHQLYGTCPAGHSTRQGRWSWTRLPAGLVIAHYRGYCRRCGGRPVEETIELNAGPATSARLPSPAELADPAVAASRRVAAALLDADPTTPWVVRQQLRRDYGL